MTTSDLSIYKMEAHLAAGRRERSKAFWRLLRLFRRPAGAAAEVGSFAPAPAVESAAAQNDNRAAPRGRCA